MASRSVPVSAPFTWLARALDVGQRRPGALFGGLALLVAVAMIPTMIQIVGEAAAPGSPLFAAVYLLAMLASLVLVPPLFGAAFALVQGVENGREMQATDIFAGYRDRSFAVRMILTALLMLAIYIVVLAVLVVALPGKEFWMALLQKLATAQPGVPPVLTGLPPLPPAFLLWLPVALLVVVLLGHAHMLAMAQASLGGRGPVEAVADGFGATLRNVVPLVAVAIVVAIAGFVLMLILAVIVGLVAAVLAAISPVLMALVLVPTYLAFVLVMYVLMFGFYFHAWHAMLGDGDAPPAPRDDTIAA